MRIGILRMGHVDTQVAQEIMNGLITSFPGATFEAIEETQVVSEKAFDKKRRQHRSDVVLREIQAFSSQNGGLDRVLGIVDLDVFVPSLNFVFGEATCPGKVALISLWRLRPEFYGNASDMELFLERSLKEAVHELGHTFGLNHCSRASCVMHFSNSILDTDKKQSLFCDECHLKIITRMNRN